MRREIAIQVPEGSNARVIVDRNKRLKRMFVPVAHEFLDKVVELPAAARKAFLQCWKLLCAQEKRTYRIVYVPTELQMHEALKILEDNKLIARLNASQYRRRKGYTTVLINPLMLLTTDESMVELWLLVHPEDGDIEETSIVTKPNGDWSIIERQTEGTEATPVTG